MSDISELALERRASSELSNNDAGHPETVVIPTRYDGADLDSTAERLSTSTDEVVKLHSEAGYVVAFMGFAPGFPYLIGDETALGVLPLLELPRLETPRTAVPAGSVAVAAGYCGIYPRSSPGGWNLIGRTESVLFDPSRDPPALLEPGARVRFEPVR
jgi:KipI family sensor histidine kinase inhibitor